MTAKKFTVDSFYQAKKNKKKISVLTAYDYCTAKLLDEASVDSLLVGDSLGMVMLGYDSTLKVTVDDIIHHCKAVVRGAKRAMVIADMPFLSYHISVEDSIKNAGRIVQEGGASAVKLEGGEEILDKVKGILRAQIPVMGHLGLTPQSINMLGEYKVQGKSEMQAKKIMEDALRLQEAGVFSIVLECIPEKLAKLISEKLDIPTIGIGAGRYCDGQVLVTQDMIGMYTAIKPKFVKQYANVGEILKAAAIHYSEEISSGAFPSDEHTFCINEELLTKLY